MPCQHASNWSRSLFSPSALCDSGGLTSLTFHNGGVIHTDTLSSSFPALHLEKKKKMEPCHHPNASSQKIRLPIWRTWSGRVGSAWRSVGVFPHVTDGCVGGEKLGAIQMACVAWRTSSYPETSLFLARLFFHLAAGIMRPKAPTCAGSSAGFLSQESQRHCQDFI